jgi:hypothetical protein
MLLPMTAGSGAGKHQLAAIISSGVTIPCLFLPGLVSVA